MQFQLVQLYLELSELFGLEYFVFLYDYPMDLQACKSAIHGVHTPNNYNKHNNGNLNNTMVSTTAASTTTLITSSTAAAAMFIGVLLIPTTRALHLGLTSCKLGQASIAMAQKDIHMMTDIAKV
ncbi:hypothetical protein ACA910_006127 [Epithemia clementina (nom. ined.)]